MAELGTPQRKGPPGLLMLVDVTDSLYKNGSGVPRYQAVLKQGSQYVLKSGGGQNPYYCTYGEKSVLAVWCNGCVLLFVL